MDGNIEHTNEIYALVKLPDGRTINMKVTNNKDKNEKGEKAKVESSIPPLMD